MMMRFFLFTLSVVMLTACQTTRYYIVRHAEKEVNTMNSDVPLSAAGKQRAEALKDSLKNKAVAVIYSTPYQRTQQTALPLSNAIQVGITIYQPADTALINGLRTAKGNLLIVGHSNTVDDIINRLSQQKLMAGDLQDSQYGDLFLLKRKGKQWSMEKKHFGQ